MATAENIQAWATTAADNDDADSAIVWTEGQDPGTVNNSARAMMAAIRKFASDIGGGPTVGGTANAITITTGQDISAAHEAAGFSIRFKAANTNTGATTVNVDGEGTEAVERMDGTALQAGDIISGGIYDLSYNSSNGGYTLLGSGVYQPIDADLTAIGALAKTDGNFIVGNGTTWVAESGATARASLGLTIGTNVQAWDADLDSIAALTTTAFGRAFLTEATSATTRTTLGLGTGDSPTLNGLTLTSTFAANGGGTLGNASGDTVVIKGTTVNSAVSAMWDAASAQAYGEEVANAVGIDAGAITGTMYFMVRDNNGPRWLVSTSPAIPGN